VAYVQNPHRFNTKGLVSFSRLAVVKRESGESPIRRMRGEIEVDIIFV